MKTNADGSVTIDLKYPVKVEGEEKSSLTFKRLKAKHLKMISIPPTMTEVQDIAAIVCGVRPTEFDELDAQDTLKAVEVVTSFLESGLETGKTV